MTTTQPMTEMYPVKVGKQPGLVTIKKVPAGASVEMVLRIAELDPTDHEVRLNGIPANLNQIVGPNSSVLLFKPLAGN